MTHTNNAIPQWIKEHGHEIVRIEDSGIDLKNEKAIP